MTDGISDYGTGERGRFYYNKETGTFDRVQPQKRQEVNAPFVLRDEIVGGIESMVTGRIHDSKSSLRREYKAHGMIEKGNDRCAPPKPPSEEERYRDIRADVEKAFYDLKYDRVPLTEKEKHQCEQERQEAMRAKRRR